MPTTDPASRECGAASGPDFKGSVRGGSKTLFRLPGSPHPTRLIVTEAPIDALSLAASKGIRADTAYVATGGGMGPGTIAAIDGAHLLAPHVAASARDAQTRRLGVATMTDLCARGRKRGISPVITTQRLAKLAASVASELHNVLLGLNIFDRDVACAGDFMAAEIVGHHDVARRQCRCQELLDPGQKRREPTHCPVTTARV